MSFLRSSSFLLFSLTVLSLFGINKASVYGQELQFFSPQSFHTFGTLEEPEVQRNRVCFSGSVVSEFKDPINGFRIQFSGKNEKISTLPIKSKKFNVKLSLRDKEQFKNTLIAISPLSGSKEGSPLFQLYKPIYPIPTKEESDLVGDGDFLEKGLHILNLLTGFGGLKQTDTVLDVGCGLGRAAYPLAYFLSPSARYEGFDVHPQLIKMANEIVGKNFPNFCFTHVDVYNGHYNPEGQLLSTEFRFPYEDAAFDFSFLTSVFTHMLSHDTRHYLEEINRIMKADGTCLLTCFLLNDASRANIASNISTINFSYDWNDSVVFDPNIPEWAVAYDIDVFFDMLSDYGFEVVKFYKGSWDGRTEDCATYQDLIVIKKVGS